MLSSRKAISKTPFDHSVRVYANARLIAGYEPTVDMDCIHERCKEIEWRKIILNCAGAPIIRDDKILFQRRTDNRRRGLIRGSLAFFR